VHNSLFIGSLFDSTTNGAAPSPSPCERTLFSMPAAMTPSEDGGDTTAEPDSTGVYETPDSSLRAFVTDLPKTPNHSRVKTQVDLVLPPLPAFNAPGPCNFFNPCQPTFLLTLLQPNQYYSGLQSLDSKASTGQQFSNMSNNLRRSGKDGSLLVHWMLMKQLRMFGISSPKVRPSTTQMESRPA